MGRNITAKNVREFMDDKEFGKFKAEVIYYCYTHTIDETAKKFNLSRSMVSRWRREATLQIVKYNQDKKLRKNLDKDCA